MNPEPSLRRKSLVHHAIDWAAWSWLGGLVVLASLLALSARLGFGVEGFISIGAWCLAAILASRHHLGRGNGHLVAIAVLTAIIATILAQIDSQSIAFLIFWIDIAIWGLLAVLGITLLVRGGRPLQLITLALILCGLSLFLGFRNSDRVSSIQAKAYETERTNEEIKLQEQKLKEAEELIAKQKIRTGGSEGTTRFAEETDVDAADLGGLKGINRKEAKAAMQERQAAMEFIASQRGKQTRTASGASAYATLGEKTIEKADETLKKQENLPELTSAQVAQANLADRLNLYLLRLSMYVVLFLAIFAYFEDQARAVPRLPAVPLGAFPLLSWLIDALFPPNRVAVACAVGVDANTLANTLAKTGDVVIWCGPGNPFESGWAGKVQPYPGLPVLVVDEESHHWWSEFLVDAAWFGRYAVVVNDEDRAHELLAAQPALQRHRARQHADALRTIHWIWAFPDAPSISFLKKIGPILGKVNQRFIVVSPEMPEKDERHLYDAIVDGHGEPITA